MTRTYKHSVSSVICALFIIDSVGTGAAASGAHAPAVSQASHATESQARRPPLVDYAQWLEYKDYQPASVFGFEQLTVMLAGLRESERLIETAHHTRELLDRWWNNVELMVGEGEINDRIAAEAEARQAYEALVAEYERLRQAARQDGGAGLLGMISTLGANILLSAVPGVGPMLGAAIAGGFGRAINGGSFGEVLVAMGLAAGAAGMAQELTGALGEADAPQTPGGAGVAKDPTGAVVAGATASFTVTQIGLAIERDIVGARAVTPVFPVREPGPAPSTFPSRGLERAATMAPVPLPIHDRWSAPALQPWAQTVVRTAVRDVASAARAAAPRAGPPRRPSLAAAVDDARWLGGALPGPVLTGDRLLAVRANMRRLERSVDLAMHSRYLYDRYQRDIELLIQEAEINGLDARLAELNQAYEEVKAAYDDLARELDKPRSWFPAAFGFAMGIVGTIVGGPLLGASLAGAAGGLANGGGAGDVLVAAGVSAGAAYVYQAAVPILRDAMQGASALGAADTPPSDEPLYEIARMSHRDDPAQAAAGYERMRQESLLPDYARRISPHVPKNLGFNRRHNPGALNYTRQHRGSSRKPEWHGRSGPRVGPAPAPEAVESLRARTEFWNNVARVLNEKGDMLRAADLQRAQRDALQKNGLPPHGSFSLPDDGGHLGPHPGRCCAWDKDGDGIRDAPLGGRKRPARLVIGQR